MLMLLFICCLCLCCLVAVQFDDEFVKKHYKDFESAEDMRASLLSSTMLERVKDLQQVTARVQGLGRLRF